METQYGKYTEKSGHTDLDEEPQSTSAVIISLSGPRSQSKLAEECLDAFLLGNSTEQQTTTFGFINESSVWCNACCLLRLVAAANAAVDAVLAAVVGLALLVFLAPAGQSCAGPAAGEDSFGT